MFLNSTGVKIAGLALLSCILSCLPAMVSEEPIEDLIGTGLSLGCSAGDVTPHRAILWVRTEDESLVSVHYGKESNLRQFTHLGRVKVTDETDFTTKFRLDGLEPKTVYFYRGAVIGKKPGPICHFVTAPLPDDRVDVQFAFSGDTREMYKPFSIMDSIRAMRPEFFLFLGDTIYADREGVASELSQFWGKYARNRNDPPTRRLLSETGIYVTWDDHEVENDFGGSHPLAPIGRRAFIDYWPVRQDTNDPARLYRSFRWGRAAEILILDTRQYRDPHQGTILGTRQKEWFLETLASSTAWFKFVATSVSFSSSKSDRWGGFSKERDEILNFIAEKKINGVVFLSADLHFAAVANVGGELRIKEYIVGPMAAPLNWLAIGYEKSFEFFSNDSYNYGFVKIYAGANPPYAEIKILDQNNKLLHKSRITASLP